MPVIENASCRVRIAMGCCNGVLGSTAPLADMTILEGTINPSSVFAYQPEVVHNTWLYAVEGSLEVVFANRAITLNKGESVAIGNIDTQLNLHNRQSGNVRFALFSGRAIKEHFIQKGPFAMASEQQLIQARKDFTAGKFGRVD